MKVLISRQVTEFIIFKEKIDTSKNAFQVWLKLVLLSNNILHLNFFGSNKSLLSMLF